ncbi:MAG: class I SAM-dependent methyltransferase [Eubacteriales bacterium]|nr:class I SAM-dependent methyltransferase [Eubacteriales bacterium]
MKFQDWKNELDRPIPYQPGAPFWTDAHLSDELLKEHLRQDTDAASYRPETIDAICAFLQSRLGWRRGTTVVDLGCGPGLYCARLAALGIIPTGIDQSTGSLRYARDLCRGTAARFLYASYLEPFGTSEYDAAIMISQDYGVLSPRDRKTLLRNIHTALRPDGRFALDLSSPAAYTGRREEALCTWETAQRGLWRPHPYLALHAVHLYPELSALCDLFAVLDDTVTVYRIWQTFFSPEDITQELAQAAFDVEAVYANLAGDQWDDSAPTLGVLCRKR